MLKYISNIKKCHFRLKYCDIATEVLLVYSTLFNSLFIQHAVIISLKSIVNGCFVGPSLFVL